MAVQARGSGPDFSFSDDTIRTAIRRCNGQPRTFVILSMGSVSREALQQVDAFVAWRIRQQERACEYLAEHWSRAPRGPTYTLVLDCDGLRPFHFGRGCRRALGRLEYIFTNYYPDFVGETIVVNAPKFLRPAWAVVSRMMPAWWGVRLGSMSDLEGAEDNIGG